MTKPNVMREKAISFIREARTTHVLWASFLRENPDWTPGQLPANATVGDATHHDKWVENYDVVLKELGATS
jgi:hypothetical protein